MQFRKLSLLDIKLRIPRSAKQKTIVKGMAMNEMTNPLIIVVCMRCVVSILAPNVTFDYFGC